MNGVNKSASPASGSWQLQEAKACFSELVRRARDAPQRVTVRGKEAVVVISAEEYEQRSPSSRCALDELMASSPLSEIDFDRTGNDMPVREVRL